jgi:hypothetical protein
MSRRQGVEDRQSVLKTDKPESGELRTRTGKKDR